jgi:putative flippase GtrA
MPKLLAMFLRHQLGSIAASALDFSTMIGAVRMLGLHPALATACGAAAGGTLNFSLGHGWIFRDAERPAIASAWRYALVSGASMLLNSAGEYVLVSTTRLHYVAARVLVAIAVSVLWNFPLQRVFVYRDLTAS